MSCLFCRILRKEISAETVYEDDAVLAFHDIHPQAPIHVLVIPKRHIEMLDDLTETSKDRIDMGILLERTAHVARLLKVHRSGYRTVINTRSDAGQEVFHLHLHILAGRPLGPMVLPASV